MKVFLIRQHWASLEPILRNESTIGDDVKTALGAAKLFSEYAS